MTEPERFVSEKIWASSAEIVKEAFYQIRKYQTGELRPASTGFPYIDKAMLGGFYPQQSLAIGARPGVGKSWLAQRIMDNVMNPIVNPQAMDYAWLRCEFEMNPIDLMLRSLSEKMGKPIEDILLYEQTSAEDEAMKEILRKENSKRITYVPRPASVEQLQRLLFDEYMPAMKDKKLVIVSIDHTALLAGSEDVMTKVNKLMAMLSLAKRTFPNIFFLIISQLNREIESRRDPKDHMPKQSDFYYSDALGQFCTLMVALNNPRRLGYSSYMNFPQGWHKDLERFKTEGGRSFRTEGLLFHHIVKVRQKSLEEIQSIHVDIMKGYERMYPDGGIVRADRVIDNREAPTETTEAPPSYPVEEEKPVVENEYDIPHDVTPY